MYLFVIFSGCLVASLFALSAPYYAQEDAAQYFEDFVRKFNKTYKNIHEKEARFETFKDSLEVINQKNKKSPYAVFGITEFADWTPEEFKKMHSGISEEFQINCRNVVNDEQIPDAGAPAAFDWRSRNIVTSVKHQQTCGSCFAFSAVGTLEAQYAKKTGQHIDLSEQQILDCDRQSHGCRGGYMSSAFQMLMQKGGSMLENDYKYENVQGSCRSDQSKAVVKVTDCHSYSLRSQEKLKQKLYSYGPMSVGVQSAGLNHYEGGILSDSECCVGKIDHAVLLVGYGTENGVDYWILKNSWGTSFGESGYFKIQRGTGCSCGILDVLMATAEIA